MRSSSFLPPWVLQVFGMTLILGFSIHWWITGQESATLIGVGVTLMITGSVQSGMDRVQRKLYKGNPPEDSKREEDERS